MRQLVILAVALATISSCGVSQDQYVAKETEAQKYKQALQQESSKTNALEQKNSELEAQMNTLQKQLQELSAKAQTTSAQRAALQAETGELKGRQSTVLTQQVLFPENSSKLTAEEKRSLDSISEALTQVRDKAVIVAAYTDDTEGGKNNTAKRWQLSSARAVEVAKYLAGRGIDPKMIGVAGFGESRPVAPNDSIANRALNRRVEVVLAPPEFRMKTIDLSPATLSK
jgi:chemotaxis protein MotB